MIVCITEKPSVAKDIAQILGATCQRDGYYEGNGYRVTWTYGHLCTLKEPADYTDQWKRWSLGSLPMFPEKFGIKLIADKGIERQFNVIKSLISDASEIINCGDAGQEGELIQRWVMQKASTKCPVKRLWISSLTDESIREGFNSLKPQANYDTLYYAGVSRAIGDWILGLNATRLYTLKYSQGGNGVLSIGRVQTPTLALIVQRQYEIDNFTPVDYWELKTLYRDVTFNSVKGKYETEQAATDALGQIINKPLVVKSVDEKKGKEAPLRLFDLTSLQVECNKKWGWTADETLKLIQTLYEKKVTTYPRVDTTYLPDDLYPKIPDIMRQMTPYSSLTSSVLQSKIPKSKKVFDNSKVTDHHAIIPTGQSPSVLYGDEKELYHLIALRFIAAFYPDCIYSQTTILADVGGVEFKAVGKVINTPGWRAVFESKTNQNENSDDTETRILPPMAIGETGTHTPSLLKKQTQPPKLYTEGTLLRAMESAGKTVEDEELREAMKENGIGRPSTRASIIETLFGRKYIARKGKSIIATQAGKDLIAIIKEDLIKSAKLTGIWENKLRQIERGSYNPAKFINELKLMMEKVVTDVLSDNSARQITIEQNKETDTESGRKSVRKESKPKSPRIKDISQIICPECGEGHIIKGRSAYGCSRYKEGCKMILKFEDYPSDLTPQRLQTKITRRYKNG